MAFNSNTVWEVRNAGSDTQGGGYDTSAGTTDYSQQDSAQLSVTDGVTVGTSTVTSVTGGFTAQMVGNCINIAGTVYQITARASTNSITVDRSTGTGTGQTMKVGGAFGSPGYASGVTNIRNTRIWVKAASTYTQTSTSFGVSGGQFGLTESQNTRGDNNIGSQMMGYTTTRGDGGQATVSAGALTSFNMCDMSGQGTLLANFILDSNGGSGVTQVYGSNYMGNLHNIKTIGASSGGMNVSNKIAMNCVTLNGGLSAAIAINCYTEDNFNYSAATIDCIVYSTTANNASAGFTTDSSNYRLYTHFGSKAYNCSTGFFASDSQSDVTPFMMAYCVTVSCGTGYTSYSNHSIYLEKCADYNSGTPVSGTPITFNRGFITLTGDPFVSASTGDFSFNATSGAGAALSTLLAYGQAVSNRPTGGGSSGQRSNTFGG